MSRVRRRVPVGAEVQPDGTAHVRIWAPDARETAVVVERGVEVALTPEADGYRSAIVEDAGAGTRYRIRLDGQLFADPASRFQPDGPFGPSEIVDPARYRWRDAGWRGVRLPGQVLYELHVGTFTPEGTWAAAAARLPQLASTGITVVEVMPVAEFPGRFGWGYDGVLPYAPTRLYGTPDDFRAFVDAAHQLGLGVILDVVYNHLGPDGCVHRAFARDYFAGHGTDWGEALNFDGPRSAPVREYFASNAAYWIDEFHLDGLRLDAVHSIHDSSAEHIVALVTRRAREAAGTRDIIVICENEQQEADMMRPVADGGYGLDAAWNDDFHHSAVVALLGRREAYLSDHFGRPQEFISAAKYGFLFQGQRYAWQNQPRGTRAGDVPPAAFVNFIENHDQLANSGDGARLWTRTPGGRYRAMTALLLLLPGTPLIFQGQEFGASTPFLYFADHKPELAAAVLKGRAEFVSQFPSLATEEAQARLPVPHDPGTFERCKLRWEEREANRAHVQLHQDLLALRCREAAFSGQRPGALDGAVIAPEAFVLRFSAAGAADERLLVVNFGDTLAVGSLAEPLVAPPGGHRWTVRWSSEHPDYGGPGATDIVTDRGWQIIGPSATVLAPTESEDAGRKRD